MSNIYIQEPPTFGKVLLITTVGDIDIELWARETPKACRNFVQLAMEGYYNGTIFHRIVKGFIAQGGDPTGTGTGGESIYGQPFKDEFHSRLRFVRRGLVAMANSAKDDNGSQFFFTFAACPELQNKHTIFGKVAGETIYNMIKLEEAETDENETPIYPHKIIRAEILHNPFPDIVPRCLPQKKEKKKKPEKKTQGVKNFKLLSFGEEAQEDEEESKEISSSLAGKGKSSHDVLNDPKLSSVPALEKNTELSDDVEDKSDEDSPVESKKLKAEDVRKKLKRQRSRSKSKEKENADVDNDDDDEEYDFRKEDIKKKKQRLQEITKEIEALKKDYRKNRKHEEKKEETKNSKKSSSKEEKEEQNEIVQEYKQNLEKYKHLKTNVPKKGSSREMMTLELLAGFKKRLQAIKEKAEEEEEKEEKESKETLTKKEAKEEEEEEADNNTSWLAHKLQFEGDDPVVAKDANLKNDDWFEITDPRNAINKRRREQSKAAQQKP